jgi:hypothetical protein
MILKADLPTKEISLIDIQCHDKQVKHFLLNKNTNSNIISGKSC